MASFAAEDSVRTANDRTFNVLWGLGETGGVFLCECRTFCTDEVRITLSQYMRLRDRGETLYAPGHVTPIPLRT